MLSFAKWWRRSSVILRRKGASFRRPRRAQCRKWRELIPIIAVMIRAPISRRSFLVATATTAAFACLPLRAAEPRRKKIALIGTEVRRHSHAQHFIDRL